MKFTLYKFIFVGFLIFVCDCIAQEEVVESTKDPKVAQKPTKAQKVIKPKTDYCDPDLCATGKKHIGCKNKGNFAFNCPANRTIINLSDDNIEQILDIHNKFRNKIASGNEEKYKSASQMTTMTWDKELAELAVLNVKQCEMKHDQCRGTKAYKYAGQNLCTRKKSKEYENLDDAIDNCISTWYEEKEFASQQDIDRCCNLESSNPIGHFTVIVNDRANKVGCAIIRFKKKGRLQTLMSCNYSFTNMLDKKIYKTGKAASDCSAGTNPDYEALCSEDEVVNPNDI